jgi:hypothetical protein
VRAARTLSKHAIRRVLVKLGEPRSRCSPVSRKHRQTILDLHARGTSIKDISAKLGLDFTTVYRVPRRTGRVGRRRRGRCRRSFDETRQPLLGQANDRKMAVGRSFQQDNSAACRPRRSMKPTQFTHRNDPCVGVADVWRTDALCPRSGAGRTGWMATGTGPVYTRNGRRRTVP